MHITYVKLCKHPLSLSHSLTPSLPLSLSIYIYIYMCVCVCVCYLKAQKFAL